MPAPSPRDQSRFVWSRFRYGILSAALLAHPAAAAPELELSLPSSPAGDRIRLSSPLQEGKLLRLESSADMAAWTEAGRLHDALFGYPDPVLTPPAKRYYRLWVSDRGPADDWKNQALFPEDAFLPEQTSEAVRWIKFAILKNDPGRIYFQDSRKYPFHYDFATVRLPGFQGMSRSAFDAVSLRRAGQQVVLGTLLYPPRANYVEYGVQFVGLDPYTPQEIGAWFEAVKATVHAAEGAGAVYMPVFEQAETARQRAAEFEALGITVASLDRWTAVSHSYSPGWALGRLKFFPSGEIDAAFADGRLLPTDILLTDGVPAETPMVAGIISLTPGTPNSHTAILARSFGIPYVHLPDPADRARIQQLAGRKIILRAIVQFDESSVSVIDVEDALEPAVESSLLALKAPAPIDYTPKASFGAISASTDALTPADIRFFGGKAANYGLLRRTVPDHCPEAIALSFDLWDAFMSQTIAGGVTLRQEIASRLAPHSTYPPQMMGLKTTLDGIRDLIRNHAQFTPAQKQSIITALSGFTPGRKIRFRSSTNVEDSATFTGAGLYDSYSGCLLDDLDSDSSGPCACDASETDERGVFRAIQRVYASFYNDNAWLERLRHGVKETEVAMGVLVHHSFPDGEELANGVATLGYRFSGSIALDGKMVSQLGAESVTNPEGTSLPEVVEVFTYGDSADLAVRQQSSRIPLGGHVVTWQKDYLGFIELFKTIGTGYRQLFPQKERFELDFEYKKDVNLGLVVKQVREIPATGTSAPVTAFLINDPQEWRIAQKEYGDVFSNHRLKSLWRMQTVSKQLTPDVLAEGIYTSGVIDFLENGTVTTLSGNLSTWPGGTHSADGTQQTWTTGSGAGLRTWQLTTDLTSSIPGTRPPVVTAGDFPLSLEVKYATPVPLIDWEGKYNTTTTDYAVLERTRTVTPGATLVRRTSANGKGVSLETSFYWPDEPPTAGGYTAPLVHFVETRITGLTTLPVVLKGYYSQTYRPGHHNFTEEFIFEPGLEPGLPPATLAELNAANIRFLHVHLGFFDEPFTVLGLDGKLRPL